MPSPKSPSQRTIESRLQRAISSMVPGSHGGRFADASRTPRAALVTQPTAAPAAAGGGAVIGSIQFADSRTNWSGVGHVYFNLDTIVSSSGTKGDTSWANFNGSGEIELSSDVWWVSLYASCSFKNTSTGLGLDLPDAAGGYPATFTVAPNTMTTFSLTFASVASPTFYTGGTGATYGVGAYGDGTCQIRDANVIITAYSGPSS